jgi:glycosyltransferase involved in cell wall biosynthesis
MKGKLMKITHLCLNGVFTDGWNYQENMLAKYHKLSGYDVTVITTEWMWDESGSLVKSPKNQYINDDGVEIRRLPLKGKDTFHKTFRRYRGLYQSLVDSNPDILFIHGPQTIDTLTIKKFAKEYTQVQIFADNHADFSNSATNWLSKVVLHKIIWRRCVRLLIPYVDTFYGVLPARVDFLKDMYGIPEEKLELLEMGADDELVSKSQRNNTQNLRDNLNISHDDFLIVTGGKIDQPKIEVLNLMKAVSNLNQQKIKLVVFGSVDEDLKKEFERLVSNSENIIYVGWISAEETYDYFSSSDLVMFPGRHSVFWEQVAGQGIPMAVKYWEGTTHIDKGGNVVFLGKATTEEISETITDLIENPIKLKKMQQKALEVMDYFSYKEISLRSIQQSTQNN